MQHLAALCRNIHSHKVHSKLIYNCDETMVDVTEKTAPKVITLREYTKVYKKSSGITPQHITLVATIS